MNIDRCINTATDMQSPAVAGVLNLQYPSYREYIPDQFQNLITYSPVHNLPTFQDGQSPV